MEVKAIHSEDVKRIDLGGGSWAKELLTKKTVGAKKTMLALSTFKPGTGTAARVHEEEELCYILEGEGLIECNGEQLKISEGMSVYIPAHVNHGVRNSGVKNLSMIYVFSSPEYPETEIRK